MDPNQNKNQKFQLKGLEFQCQDFKRRALQRKKERMQRNKINMENVQRQREQQNKQQQSKEQHSMKQRSQVQDQISNYQVFGVNRNNAFMSISERVRKSRQENDRILSYLSRERQNRKELVGQKNNAPTSKNIFQENNKAQKQQKLQFAHILNSNGEKKSQQSNPNQANIFQSNPTIFPPPPQSISAKLSQNFPMNHGINNNAVSGIANNITNNIPNNFANSIPNIISNTRSNNLFGNSNQNNIFSNNSSNNLFSNNSSTNNNNNNINNNIFNQNNDYKSVNQQNQQQIVEENKKQNSIQLFSEGVFNNDDKQKPTLNFNNHLIVKTGNQSQQKQKQQKKQPIILLFNNNGSTVNTNILPSVNIFGNSLIANQPEQQFNEPLEVQQNRHAQVEVQSSRSQGSLFQLQQPPVYQSQSEQRLLSQAPQQQTGNVPANQSYSFESYATDSTGLSRKSLPSNQIPLFNNDSNAPLTHTAGTFRVVPEPPQIIRPYLPNYEVTESRIPQSSNLSSSNFSVSNQNNNSSLPVIRQEKNQGSILGNSHGDSLSEASKIAVESNAKQDNKQSANSGLFGTVNTNLIFAKPSAEQAQNQIPSNSGLFASSSPALFVQPSSKNNLFSSSGNSGNNIFSNPTNNIFSQQEQAKQNQLFPTQQAHKPKQTQVSRQVNASSNAGNQSENTFTQPNLQNNMFSSTNNQNNNAQISSNPFKKVISQNIFKKASNQGTNQSSNPFSLFNSNSSSQPNMFSSNLQKNSLFGSQGQGSSLFGSGLKGPSLFSRKQQDEDQNSQVSEEGEQLNEDPNQESAEQKNQGELKYDYQMTNIIIKLEAPKFKVVVTPQKLIENVKISLQKFPQSNTVYFIVRMSNKNVVFTGCYIPITLIKVISKKQKGSVSISIKGIIQIQGQQKSIRELRVMFKEEKQANQFIKESQKIIAQLKKSV